jgi:hypothetical protein
VVALRSFAARNEVELLPVSDDDAIVAVAVMEIVGALTGIEHLDELRHSAPEYTPVLARAMMRAAGRGSNVVADSESSVVPARLAPVLDRCAEWLNTQAPDCVLRAAADLSAGPPVAVAAAEMLVAVCEA